MNYASVSARHHSRLYAIAPWLSRGTAAAVIFIGCLGLAGWVFDASPWGGVLRGQPRMMPNTAVALILAGASLWLLQTKRTSTLDVPRLTGQLLASAVTAVGLLTLGEYLFRIDLGIDRLLFSERLATLGIPMPGRPSHYTALSLLLVGSGLLLLDLETRGGHLPSQSLALSAGLVAALAIEGHIVRYAPFYRVSTTTGMSIHAGIAVLLLAAGMLFTHPDRGLMAIMASNGPGGLMVRRLLPVPFAVSFVLAWLGLVGGRVGLYDRTVGVWLLQLSNLVVFTFLIWFNARLIERADLERKRAEEELQSRTGELEIANKELEAFSYSISHDLRAPLRAVDGFSRILLAESASELSVTAQHYLQRVRAGAEQMGRLIDDLLAFSRFSRQALSKKPLSVATIVSEVIDDLHAEQEGRRVEIKVSELSSCMADKALLKQVFVNLISNALKFTRHRETAQVEIGSCVSDGEHIYFVKDNGAGFDMRYADRLFGVFQRLHRPDEFDGTGVGLAIVHRVVHRHGGRVWAEAQPDRGATFYFTLGE